MEIYDFLKGRGLAIVIGAPLLAGLVVGALQLDSRLPRSRAYGRVDVPQALSGSPEDFIVVSRGPARADFRNNLTSEATARAVAQELGLRVSDVRNKLQSSIGAPEVTGIDVMFTARNEELAARGLEVGTRVALLTIAREHLEIARRAADAARVQVEAVAKELDALERSTQLVDVQAQYRAVSADILNLQALIANTANGASEARLTLLFWHRLAQRDAYARVLADYQDVQAKRGNVSAAAAEADGALRRAQLVVESVERSDVVTSERVARVLPDRAIVRPIGVAVVASFALALAFVLLAAHRRRRREAEAPRAGIDLTDLTFEPDDREAGIRTTAGQGR
jgi:hypothetical protein